MGEIINYNQSGRLLAELAEVQVFSERKAVLFRVIGDIRKVIQKFYPSPESVDYLENRLASYEGLLPRELALISRGIISPLENELRKHPKYEPDTLNQVFIALYDLLVKEVHHRNLVDIVDYRKDSPMYKDGINAEIGEIIKMVNVYNQLSRWVTENKRYVGGLNEAGSDLARKQFVELKKSAPEFISSLRSLSRQNYNIESAFEFFTINRAWDSYISSRQVMESTMIDCRTITSQGHPIKDKGNDIIVRFANIIHLNAQALFLQMGYEMSTDDSARNSIHDAKKFQNELAITAFDPQQITYFSVVPNDQITIDGSIKRLSPEVREFYQRLKLK